MHILYVSGRYERRHFLLTICFAIIYDYNYVGDFRPDIVHVRALYFHPIIIPVHNNVLTFNINSILAIDMIF